MDRPPLILTLPGTDPKGAEFDDYSISLSDAYTQAVLKAGGLPLMMPITASPKEVAEYIRRADAVFLTGGNDVQPELYAVEIPKHLRNTVGPVDARRDYAEMLAVQETFKQRKPLLAICRGHQILNVALGGTLIVDIPSEVKNPLTHCPLVHKDQMEHKVTLAEGSILARMFGKTEIEVNSSHHQAIGKLAEPLEVTGVSSDGVIEVVELRKADHGLLPYLLSVQFHPERLIKGYPEYLKLFKSFVAAAAGQTTA